MSNTIKHNLIEAAMEEGRRRDREAAAAKAEAEVRMHFAAEPYDIDDGDEDVPVLTVSEEEQEIISTINAQSKQFGYTHFTIPSLKENTMNTNTITNAAVAAAAEAAAGNTTMPEVESGVELTEAEFNVQLDQAIDEQMTAQVAALEEAVVADDVIVESTAAQAVELAEVKPEAVKVEVEAKTGKVKGLVGRILSFRLSLGKKKLTLSDDQIEAANRASALAKIEAANKSREMAELHLKVIKAQSAAAVANMAAGTAVLSAMLKPMSPYATSGNKA